MTALPRRAALGLLLGAIAACGRKPEAATRTDLYPGETPELRRQIDRYAGLYEVPVDLVHRVVQRESGYNPKARNGRYYGLMQIDPRTALTMGYHGRPEGLLDPEQNLKYGVKYLRGAWLVSDGDKDTAIGWYARGYYYEAKRRGLLVETGLRSA